MEQREVLTVHALSVLSWLNQSVQRCWASLFVLLPAILKVEGYALHAHVLLIAPIQQKKSPFQTQLMLFYLISDR